MTDISKYSTNYCNIPNCKRLAIFGRKICFTHKFARWAKKNPMRVTYKNLKNRAKQRGKEFTLAFEEFKEFCERTNYIALKGIYPDDMTINRIYDDVGYTKDNIEMLTNRDNLARRKHWSPKKYVKIEGDVF